MIDNTVWMNPAELIPYPNNAKIHPPEQIDRLANGIKAFGWTQPIVIDKNNVVVIGHGRLLAAKQLMLDKVPVVMRDDLTEEQINACRLEDNKTNESPWDFGKLEEELAQLAIDGFDMEQFGFEVGEDYIDHSKDIVEDEAPEVQEEAVSKVGQIYQLGRHRLMCGDSTDQKSVEKLMNGTKARMVFTDPPWNVNYGADDNNSHYKARTIINDSMSTEDFKEFMNNAFRCMNDASEDGCMTYVVMSAQEWGNMMLTLNENEYHWSSTIIWNKDQLVLSRKDYHTKYEPIWYGWKIGDARLHPLEDRKQCDVWDFDRPKRSDEHPTMKPVELVARAITNSSNIGDSVLDLFGGSGTTLIASEQTNRACFMMELDPRYVDVIVKRWENLTGQKAVLLNDPE